MNQSARPKPPGASQQYGRLARPVNTVLAPYGPYVYSHVYAESGKHRAVDPKMGKNAIWARAQGLPVCYSSGGP